MTIQELINQLQDVSPGVVWIIFLSPPLLAWMISFFCSYRHPKPCVCGWLYAFLIYIVCIPGIFSAVLTGYSLFFLRQNLLQVNVIVYFLPLVSMAATLFIIRQHTEDWAELPGVGRIYALMALIGISFVIALAVERTRIWIIFGGSFMSLLFIALIGLAVLKWSVYLLFRKRNDPTRRFSEYTDLTQEYAKQLEELRKRLSKR